MPWIPELFSAPVLARLEEKWQRERLDAVPYYDGLMSGEHDALIGAFAGEPVLHDPLHGRVRGARSVRHCSPSGSRVGVSQPLTSDSRVPSTEAGPELAVALTGDSGRPVVCPPIGASRASLPLWHAGRRLRTGAPSHAASARDRRRAEDAR